MKTQAASIACRWFGGAAKALAAVALVCAMQARAEYKTWYDGKRTWTYFATSGGEAALYNGGNPVIPVSTTGNVAIPENIDGLPVTSIGDDAFAGCASITGLTAPDGIKSVGEGAFAGCSSLKSVRLPFQCVLEIAATEGAYGLIFSGCPADLALSGSVIDGHMTYHAERDVSTGRIWTYFTEEGHDGAILSGWPIAVDEDDNPLQCSACLPVPTGLLEIPETIGGIPVMAIFECAFLNCTGITGLSIPEGVIIADGAFMGCSGLADANGFIVVDGLLHGYCGKKTDITIPDGVKGIGFQALSGNKTVKNVTIPGSVEYIGEDAFFRCTSLRSVTMLNGVKTIYTCAFDECSSLASVTIPDSVTCIQHDVFRNCAASLYDTSVPGVKIVDGWVFECDGEYSGAVNLTGAGVRGIAEGAFSYCYNLTGVTIPDGVKLIGDYAFQSSGLSGVTIPGNVKNVGNHTFEWCDGLTSVSIANGVESIGEYAFIHCTALAEITVPDSVTNIGEGAFCHCENLKKASLPGHLRGKIPSDVFEDCPADLVVTYREAVADSHTLKFDSNGGVFSGANFGGMNGKSGVAQVAVSCGKGSFSSGMRATRSGYVFQGWWTAASGGSQQYDANGKFVGGSTCWTSDGKWKHHGNAMLYARWGSSSDSHALKFDSNGGVFSGSNFGSMAGKSGIVQVAVSCGKGSFSSGMRATKSGATFNGWWTAVSGGSMQYDANGKFVGGSTCWTSDGKWKHHGNATLYARWTDEPHGLAFDPNGGVLSGANFGAANGTSAKTQVWVTCGKGSYSSGMRATKSGATFKGWWTAPVSGGSMQYDANGKFVPNSTCWDANGKWKHHGNATLYARW